MFDFLRVLCFQGQPLQILFYSIAAGVKCRMAAIKSLPILNHSARFILIII